MVRAFLTPEEIEAAIEPFVNNRTGIMAGAFELQKPSGYPDICVYSSDVSNVAVLHDNVYLPRRASSIGGAGSSTQRNLALTKAYCEALERYCNVVYDPASVIVASRDELGDAAIDLNLFAQGSADEYQFPHPRNIFAPPDNSKPLRWLRGYSLITGKPIYVPFMAVYISSPYIYPAEAFITPISTGSALAASYEQAIISGLCEVIERDALMITWLQELPLPRIDVSTLRDPEFQERLKRVEAAGLKQVFFDASLDLGVSTIYALQINPSAQVAGLVMASTKLDPVQAMIRVMDESAPSRIAITHWTHNESSFDPQDFRTFNLLEDGAVYYANAEHLPAFDFLLNHSNTRQWEDLPYFESGDVSQNLDQLVDQFRENHLELVAVDMSIKPLRDVGLYTVKVIAPQLIPLAVNYNLRYKGSPRLYEVPAKLGYPVKSPDELNPNPQPFA